MVSVELPYVCLKKSFSFTKYYTCTYKTETYFSSVVYSFTLHVRLLLAHLYRGTIRLHVCWYSLSYRAFSDKITGEGEINSCTINKQLITGY